MITRYNPRSTHVRRTLALPLLLLIPLGRYSHAQAPPAGKGPEQEGFQISVDVDLVVLQATVRDRDGHTVPHLGEQDFKVYQDGALQPIRLFRHEDTPVTAGLVIDHSGSMREKLAEVTAAARAFVQSSNPQDQMFVVNFNENVSLGLPGAMRFSGSADELGSAIGAAPAIGTTALYDAIAEGLERLRESNRDKKVLIVISDGGDNASKLNLDRVLKMAEESSAIIYTIGIFDPDDPDRNPKVLRRLSHETGGEAFFPARPSESVEICQRIARDIRDQYTIGFSSTNGKRNGAYHAIRVVARAKGDGKLSVRTRAGYVAGRSSPPPDPNVK
jgi:Ca-activated chloride channel family protein